METKGVQISMRKFRLCFPLATKEKINKKTKKREAGVLLSKVCLSTC